MNHLQSLSWKGLVLNMIEDLNPELHEKLLDDGTLDEYATECARGMADQYESQTRGADPMRRASVREVLLAQMREEIEAELDPPCEYDGLNDLDLHDAKMILDSFYGSSSSEDTMFHSANPMPSVVGYQLPDLDALIED